MRTEALRGRGRFADGRASFAAALERGIARSGVKLIEAKLSRRRLTS
jgi:hypothetical protein